jgi:hypothetical protein
MYNVLKKVIERLLQRAQEYQPIAVTVLLSVLFVTVVLHTHTCPSATGERCPVAICSNTPWPVSASCTHMPAMPVVVVVVVVIKEQYNTAAMFSTML